MANWACPHTPASYLARAVLDGGPFHGEHAAFIPPDTSAPVQIVWSGWLPWGFDAYLDEWHGEVTWDRGRTDSLIFRCTGRHLTVAQIPPLLAEDAELWADGAVMLEEVYGVPRELLWPGL